MTSFSTILGILPIAIGWGAGGESRRPMGVAAVGGLLTSTFLTLLVIPVAYTLFADLAARLRGHRAARRTVAVAVTGLLACFALTVPVQAEETPPPADTSPVVAQLDGTNATVQYALIRCVDTALQNNFDIQKARERVRRQYGTVVELRSRLIPNLGMEGQYSESDTTLTKNNPGGFEAKQENWNLGIQVTQSIYAGGGDRAAFKGQKLLEEASVRDLQTTVNTVLLEVRERFYGVLLARSQIRVQEQNIQL